MATPQENIARFQEIANRGLQDKLDPDKRARFDEAVKRGIITVKSATNDPTQVVQPEAQPEPKALPLGYPSDMVIEPVQAVLGGLSNQLISGVEGVAKAVTSGGDLDAAAETIKQRQQKLPTYAPETAFGAKGVKKLGDLIAMGVDFANVPLSGMGAVADYILTLSENPQVTDEQALESAKQTYQTSRKGGAFATLGDTVLERTGSPLAATGAALLPEIAGAVTGIAGAGAASTALTNLGKGTLKALAPKQKLLITPDGEPTKALEVALKNKGLTFQDIMDDVENLPINVKPEVAVTRLMAEKIKRGDGEGNLALYRLDDAGRPVDDALAKEAMRQQFELGDIQTVKLMNGDTKREAMNMAKMKQQIYATKSKALDFRPSDVIGRNVLEGYEFINAKTELATTKLSNLAKSQKFKNQRLDVAEIQNNFFGELDKLKVPYQRGELARRLTPDDFAGSRIAKDPTAQKAINDVIDLLSYRATPNAERAHDLKQQLDQLINYEKMPQRGLTDAADKLIRSVRTSLNDAIRAVDPNYAKINDKLSISIDAMNDFRKAMGKTIDEADPDVVVGKEMRKLMSNYRSGPVLDKATIKLDDVARQLGWKSNVDVKKLVTLDNILNKRFGETAERSLQGVQESAIKNAMRDINGQHGVKGPKEIVFGAVLKKAGKTIEEQRNINDQQAFKALERLLKRQSEPDSRTGSSLVPYKQ